MRVLILSGNTGEGHNTAGKALKYYLEQAGCECQFQDGLIFLSRFTNAVICKSHTFLYRRMPKVFGIGYRISEKHSKHLKYQQTLEKWRKKPSNRFKNFLAFLENGNFDAIVCVHPFTAKMVSILRASGKINIPCYFIATDYTCSPTVNQYDLDAWFIPHSELIPEFMSYCIPRDKLIPTGIPVMPSFTDERDKLAARRELQLPEDKQIVLLSCGSMGAGTMGRLALLLSETLPKNTLLVAICGNNQKLKRRLQRLIRSDKVIIKGFVDRMDRYMDAADLYLTKPGGLSTTEAIFKRVPMILIHAVPGCETRNLEFLTAIGCAVTAKGIFSIARLVRVTLRSGKSLSYLTDKCAIEFTQNGAIRICEELLKKSGVSQHDQDTES